MARIDIAQNLAEVGYEITGDQVIYVAQNIAEVGYQVVGDQVVYVAQGMVEVGYEYVPDQTVYVSQFIGEIMYGEYVAPPPPPEEGAHGIIDVTRLCKISGPTRYQIVIVDHDGTNLTLINEFERLEYVKALNGRGHHGWGTYHMHGAASTIPAEYFTLDRLVSVRRLPQDAEDWVIDFEGLNRTYGSYYSEDDDIERFLSEGFDLRSLLRRRVIQPAAGNAFVTLDGTYTDIVRQLVDGQMGAAAGARSMLHFVVEPLQGEGPSPTDPLNFRWTQLSEELEVYGAGVGFDFDVVRDGGLYTFKVYYGGYGTDRRVGNEDGNNPVIFSVENGNMRQPSFITNRTQETTAAIVLGDGYGATRDKMTRYSLVDAQDDSPWNLIEILVEASQYMNSADLAAQGDAALSHFREVFQFSFDAIPIPGCRYGIDWDLGDWVTAIYNGASYSFRIVEVHVSLDRDGETIRPTILWWPEDIAPAP